jgi:hypothetical protein
VALLCYVGVLARAGALVRRAGRVSAYLSGTDYPSVPSSPSEVPYRSW